MNGLQMTFEMLMEEKSQEQTVGVLEHPVKTSHLPETELESQVATPLSLEKYLESCGKLKKKIDPNGLSMRTLRECLAVTEASIISQYSLKWTNWGTTSSGNFSTQNITYPKTGSAYTLSDILETKVIGHRKGYRLNTQVFDPDGITETLSTCQGGGREPHTAIKVAIPVLTPEREKKRQNGRRFKTDGEEAFTLTAQDRHGVAIGIDDMYSGRNTRFYDGYSPTLRSERSGVKVGIDTNDELILPPHTYPVWYEKSKSFIVIRRLTPKECFRLQGWSDDYFERAKLVNSDSQLYKQAGNGITVSVMYDIAKRL